MHPGPTPIRLVDGIAVDVGAYDAMRERQHSMWWRTLIAGPVANTSGIRGNDLPAAYLHDPDSQTEHLLFVSAPVDWDQCALGLRPRSGRRFFGLWGAVPEGVILHYEARSAPRAPTRWEALRRLILWCSEFLPEPDPSALSAIDYQAIANGAFAQSLDSDRSLVTIDGVLGHPMYVVGTSEAWDDVRADHLELLAQSDVAWGLARLGDQRTADQERWLDHLVGVLGAFWSPERQYFTNIFPQDPREFGGGNVIVSRRDGRESTNVWYHMYNHARLAEIALETRPKWAPQLLLAAEGALTLAERASYVFPLFWWVDDAEPLNGANDHGSAGAFAWFMLRAHEIRSDERFIAAARAALRTLHRLPLETLYGESTLLARAAWSAHRLASFDDDVAWLDMRDDFVAAALRMMYWHGERAGMFQACAGMAYPALFENVGILLAFEDFLDDTPFDLRRILRLQLERDVQFFDAAGPAPDIPNEALPTIEYPFGSLVGKEIYAVGEVLLLPHLHALAQAPALSRL